MEEDTDLIAYLYPHTDIRGRVSEAIEASSIRFSNVPRTDLGIIFGSNPKCDVVLPFDGVSDRHFSLTLDEVNRPIVKDLGSSMGTEVTYDTQGHGVRSKFQWIVGGAKVPQEMTPIIIKVTKTISFQIVVARHDIKSPEYIDKVNWFCRRTVFTVPPNTPRGFSDDGRIRLVSGGEILWESG